MALGDDDLYVRVRRQRFHLVGRTTETRCQRDKRGGRRMSEQQAVLLTLSPGRAMSRLTNSLPCSWGDLERL